MNRSIYYNYIEEKLVALATRIELRSKKNILDLNLHSENFYLNLFNKLYGWQLQNMNETKQNAEAIDLIDNSNKIVIQVSSTATKQKIDSALTKDLSAYTSYSFKFISISKPADGLRSKTFDNQHHLGFIPNTDLYDIQSILNDVGALEIEQQKYIYDFIKSELGSDIDLTKIDSNLAAIMKVLAQEDWNGKSEKYKVDPFEIDRKIMFNNLEISKAIIDDFMIHHGRVEKIYLEFNKLGVNKSTSVLSSIRKEYLIYSKNLNDDVLFFKVIEQVILKILHSSNYTPIPIEELELCVNILVVDAFIRCKIFKNPEGYIYAVA